jgi:hypothetical protein
MNMLNPRFVPNQIEKRNAARADIEAFEENIGGVL